MIKKYSFAVIMLIWLLGLLPGSRTYAGADHDFEKLWNSYGNLIKEYKREKAEAVLDKIYAEALKRNNSAMAARVFFLRTCQGSDSFSNKIEKIEKYSINAPDKICIIAKAFIAKLYGGFAIESGRRLHYRGPVPNDRAFNIETCSTASLFDHVTLMYKKLLSDEKCGKTKMSEYKDILTPGNVFPFGDKTLYDLLVWQALDFYSSNIIFFAYSTDTLEINSSSFVFAQADEFMAYEIGIISDRSIKLASIKLVQNAMKYHKANNNAETLIESDIRRLNHFKNIAGPKVSEVYQKRLREIIDRYPNSEYTAVAYFYLALDKYKNEDLSGAMNLAAESVKKFPKSRGANFCRALINKINEKNYFTKNEESFHSKRHPEILVKYKNIEKIYLKIFKCNDDFNAHFDYGRRRGENKKYDWIYPGESIEIFIKTNKESLHKTIDLEPTRDYKLAEKTLELPLLEPGYYRYFTSCRIDFSTSENSIRQGVFHVSDIAMLTWKSQNSIEGVAVDAESGEPRKNVRIDMHECGFATNELLISNGFKTLRTDAEGYFSHAPEEENRYLRFEASDDTGSRYLQESFFSTNFFNALYHEKIFIFTDRAIYRPGQRINFKIISCYSDPGKAKFMASDTSEIEVNFYGPNSKVIETRLLKPNEFGSASGFFTAPENKLNGQAEIRASNKNGGYKYHYFRIEEYKRPQFRVTLDKPSKPFDINDSLSVKGVVATYNDVPIQEAVVKYRVILKPIPRENEEIYKKYGKNINKNISREVASGSLITDQNGKFEITADASLHKAFLADCGLEYANCSIIADAVDKTGEARSSVVDFVIGVKPYDIYVTAPKWTSENNTFEINIEAKNLSGSTATAECEIELYELDQPRTPFRKGYGLEPDIKMIERYTREYDKNGITGGIFSSYDPALWPAKKLLSVKNINTSENGRVEIKLGRGVYKAVIYSKYKNRRYYEQSAALVVFNENDNKFNAMVPAYFAPEKTTVEPGGSFRAFWGTGYEGGTALIRITKDKKTIKRYWTKKGDTAHLLTFPVGEEMRGGFTVTADFIRENRYYNEKITVDVPWTNKKLDIRLETFRDRIEPGIAEKWKMIVKRVEGSMTEAVELLASMYDESLDEFTSHFWEKLFDEIFKKENDDTNKHYTNSMKISSYDMYKPDNDLNKNYWTEDLYFESYFNEISRYSRFYELMRGRWISNTISDASSANISADPDVASHLQRIYERMAEGFDRNSSSGEIMDKIINSKPDERSGRVHAIRKNFNETAFFMPHLKSESNEITIEFTPPDSTTGWRFMGLVHGKDLACGYIEKHAASQKKLMVAPLLPRFLSSGTTVEIGVRATNISNDDITGEITLDTSSITNEIKLNEAFGNFDNIKKLNLKAGRSETFYFKIFVPEGFEAVKIKTTAVSKKYGDGEEHLIPVLSSKITVIESMPLYLKGPGDKSFKIDNTNEYAANIATRKSSLTIQAVSNPAWYSILALPYLMQYPHGCSEQIFNKYYASKIALNIIKTRPGIAKVIESWKESGVLNSELEKNAALKSISLDETSWVKASEKQHETRAALVELLDAKKLEERIDENFDKLIYTKNSNGLWPWFPGMQDNIYITLYIYAGFGKLNKKGINDDFESYADWTTRELDEWVQNSYKAAFKNNTPEKNRLNYMIEKYLYARSFFIGKFPYKPELKKVIAYYLNLARKFKTSDAISPESSAILALTLFRNGDTKNAFKIMDKLKKAAIVDKDRGMNWNYERGYSRNKIESQALIIEALDEICKDTEAVELSKLWLINQKRAADFGTTIATAEAINAILLNGENSLENNAEHEITVGDEKIAQNDAEAGTGFYEKNIEAPKFGPDAGTVSVKITNGGTFWGSVHHKFIANSAKIKSHGTGDIKICKKLYINDRGETLREISDISDVSPAPGDTVLVRLEISTGTDMDFVFVKDMFAGTFEPVSVLSGYEYKKTFGCYVSMKDASANFFIDHLPAGDHAIEYDLRVQRRGSYRSETASIECMYAPEFNAHSASFVFSVK